MGNNRDYFYFVEDVMAMLGLSRAKCYGIIKQLNSELEEAGYLTVAGRVPRRYFDTRYYTGPAATTHTPKAKMQPRRAAMLGNQ